MRGWYRVGLAVVILCGWVLPAWAALDEPKPWENVLLDSRRSVWRVFMQWKTPEILADDGTVNPLREQPAKRDPKKYEARTPLPIKSTKPPPAGWRATGFNDRVWALRKGPYGPPVDTRSDLWTAGGPAELALVCLRHKFEIVNLAACKDLRVELLYHGGVVIYVNGKELKRVHLPKGEITPETRADPYPKDAYVNDRVANIEELRLRQVVVLIPPNMLRKGLNVVAVEVHRSPIREMIERGQAPLWGHALLVRAIVKSAFSMTPKEAVKAVDEPEEIVHKPGTHVLNNTSGYWRVTSRWKTPELVTDTGALTRLREPFSRRRHETDADRKPVPVRSTPAPPEDWMAPTFDDRDWARVRGRFGPGWGGRASIWSVGNPAAVSVIYARGRFEVLDPAACTDLEVALEYHGGAAVYLNGRQLTRGYLPEGDIDADTLAAPCPKQAYVKPNGYLISTGDAREFADYIRQNRVRLLNVPLPQDRLRKGVNVVAVEVHRAPIRDLMVSGRYQGRGSGLWPHALLLSAIVRPAGGETPESATNAATTPRGKSRLWNRLPADRLVDTDFGPPNEVLRPIEIVGTRNGAFCGQVVVESAEQMSAIKATVTDLAGPGGATIPVSAVEITYPDPDARGAGWLTARPYYTLRPDPPERIIPVNSKTKVALQPVWLKVRVPKDATPGEYKGTLTINFKIGIPDINLIDEKPLAVPVHLTVHDWALPRPQDYRTFVDFIQTPETLALKYKVPMWSDEHFAYIEKSLRLLAEAGNDAVYLRLLCKTHFGDSETWVRHVKQPDGSWKRDYSVLDRYMDLVEKTQGKPRVVVLYLWSRYTAKNSSPPLVTLLDPKTGETKMIETPRYGTPAGKAFWAPVIRELRERFAKRGYEDALMLGLTGDFTGIRGDKIAFFKEIAPGLPWVSQGHGAPGRVGDVPVGYCTTVWNARGPGNPYEGRTHGWRGGGRIFCQFPRDIWRSRGLIGFRTRPQWNITGRQQGMGRLGGDFWEVLTPREKPRKGRHHAGGSLANRWPQFGSWGQLVVRSCFLAPGRDGAISTATFEVFREGVQDCEARIFIETALLDDAQRATLGARLANRVQAVLDHRTWVLAHAHRTQPWFFQAGFIARQNDLYAAAAEVAKALAK